MTTDELSGYGNPKSKKSAIVLYSHLSLFGISLKNGQIVFFTSKPVLNSGEGAIK